MAELGLVVILVDLVVVVLGVAFATVSYWERSSRSELSYRNRTCWLVVREGLVWRVVWVVKLSG